MNPSLHMTSLRLLALAALLGVAMNAWAQQSSIEQRMTPEQFKAAGLDKLSAAELAQLNAWLDQQRGTRADKAPEEQAAPERRSDAFVGVDDGPIHGRLKGAVDDWAPGTVFELENGQRWRVLKGRMHLKKPLQSPEIVIVPGMLGGWFFQVDENLPKARVERIQ